MSTAPVPLDHLHDAVRHWISFPNIVMLTTCAKTTGGEETTQQAITVGVKEKKPPAALTSRDFLVPPTVAVDVIHPDGSVREEVVPTDVIQTGDFAHMSLASLRRPCPGGYQIASWQGWGWFGGRQQLGTLGVTTRWMTKRCFLTNCHVIGDRTAAPGLDVYQPAWSMWGSIWQGNGLIGRCDGTFDIRTCESDTENNPQLNKYDFAWCEVDTTRTSPKVSQIWLGESELEIRRNEPIKIGENVTWVGQATGQRQRAKVKGFARNKIPSRMGGWEYWQDLILLTKGALINGDSGSALIAEEDMRIIGLLTMTNDPAEGELPMATRIPEENFQPDGPDGQQMRTLQQPV